MVKIALGRAGTLTYAAIRGLLAGPAGERLWDYWKNQLAGPLPVLALPTDRPRPPIQKFRGAQHDFTLSEELARRLDESIQRRRR